MLSAHALDRDDRRPFDPEQGETAEGGRILPDLAGKGLYLPLFRRNEDPPREQNNSEKNRAITGP
jgi:hypothetical protein